MRRVNRRASPSLRATFLPVEGVIYACFLLLDRKTHV